MRTTFHAANADSPIHKGERDLMLAMCVPHCTQEIYSGTGASLLVRVMAR